MMSVVLRMTVFRIAVGRTDSIRVSDVGLRPVHKRFYGGRVPPPNPQGADWTKPALIISKHASHSLSSRAAASTSSACPSTFTFCQMRAIRPFGAMRTVVRVIP